MGRRRDHAAALDDAVVLLVAADGPGRRALREDIGRDRGRRAKTRARVRVAPGERDALRRAGRPVTIAAVDLALPGGRALDTIRALRARRPDLAILAFGAAAEMSDAIAALMAGADFFHEHRGGAASGIRRALERAVDRRRLTHEVERTEAAMQEARGRLAQLSGELVQAVPGFRPLHAREDVLPFREAARRYLLAAAKLFGGDPRGLARALGVSYFALRRLLARYEVPFPAVRARR